MVATNMGSILLVVVGLAALGVAVPINDPPGVVLIDCSDRRTIEHASRLRQNFRCVQQDETPSYTLTGTEGCPENQYFNSKTHECELISRSEVAFPRRESSTDCPEGQVYVPSIDLCLVATKSARPAALSSDSLVREVPRFRMSQIIQLPKDCAADEVYNSELSLCLKVPSRSNKRDNNRPPALSLVKEMTRADSTAFKSDDHQSSDCGEGEYWIAELGICATTTPSLPHSANLIKAQSEVSFPSDDKECDSDELFVPELGICAPTNPSKNPRPLVSDSLVKEKVKPFPTQEEVVCSSDEVYVSELNICAQRAKPQGQRRPPPSASLVKEKQGPLEITAFEDSQSPSDCVGSQIYISELGICS